MKGLLTATREFNVGRNIHATYGAAKLGKYQDAAALISSDTTYKAG